MLNRRIALAHGALLMTAPLRSFAAAPEPAARVGASAIRFASVAQARAVLGADDDWVAAIGAFHRSATLGLSTPVSREQLRAFCADAALPWSPALEGRWRKALATLAPRFNEWRLPLPPEVLLIHSSGRDAANAPYTRQNAVVLPVEAVPSNDPRADVFVLSHELFHVVSRHASGLATRLYALIGFEPVAPLQWPAEWIELRIANPDATHDRHLMRTTLNGRAVALMPLLVARRAELKPGETFFDVLDVRLLEVNVGDATLPVRRDGRPVWHAPEAVPEYLARLGGNTEYIFHPEETMADNFALLVSGQPVPNPGLLKRIEAVLLASSKRSAA